MKFKEVFMSKYTLIFININIMLEAICSSVSRSPNIEQNA